MQLVKPCGNSCVAVARRQEVVDPVVNGVGSYGVARLGLGFQESMPRFPGKSQAEPIESHFLGCRTPVGDWAPGRGWLPWATRLRERRAKRFRPLLGLEAA